MANTIEDLSILSTVPEKTLAKLFKKMVYCICDSVAQDHLDNKEVTVLDIGIGILYIRHIGEAVKYHFEPSDYLKDSLNKTLVNGENILEDVLNDSLVEKFVEVYKDIC